MNTDSLQQHSYRCSS